MEVEIKMSRKHPSSQNKKNNNNERKVVSRKANKCPNSLKKTSSLCAASHIQDSWNSGNGGDPLW